jgi:hypothetical protein
MARGGGEGKTRTRLVTRFGADHTRDINTVALTCPATTNSLAFLSWASWEPFYTT